MILFWEHGYEATSLSALTRRMGITPPSLYTAFGDKKRLFLEAVDLYRCGPVSSSSIISEASTAREAAHELLRSAATGFTGAETPRGCLLASSAISCSAEADDVRQALAVIRGEIEAALREKIRRSVEIGEIPAQSDPEALAAQVMAVIQGLSTLARDGSSREKLFRVVEVTMAGWPA